MITKTLVSALLLSAVMMGCVGPGRRPQPSPDGGRTGKITGQLKAVLARNDHQATLDFVAESLPDVPDDYTRALCEHARAQALAALGRRLSALMGYQRAWHRLTPEVEGLGSIVLEDWADEQVRSGQSAGAQEHYQLVLSSRRLSAQRQQRVIASLVVACENAGSPVDVLRWKSDLGRHATALLEAARIRLAPVPHFTSGARASIRPRRHGRIPDDSRDILPGLRARSQWSARPIGSNYSSMTAIRAITVHHSAMAAPPSGSAGSQIRSIQSNHQSGRGWADIGYHFMIDPEGGVWEGRKLAQQGAHAGSSSPGLNVGNIGVCLLGNFELDRAPDAQVKALFDVLDALTSWFDLSRDAVQPHRHFKSTTLCPGAHLSPIVASYRGEARSTRLRQ